MSIINRTCAQLASLDDDDFVRVAKFVTSECRARGLDPIATDLDEIVLHTPAANEPSDDVA